MASAIAGTVATKVREALSHKDSNGSLLQLAQQDGNEDGGFADNSVITQITTRDAAPAPTINRSSNGRYVSSVSIPTPRRGDLEDEPGSRSTWRAKFRSLLCCLAPSDQYFPHREVPPAIIRPARPVSPPSYPMRTLLGPMRVDDAGRKTLVLDLDETLVHSSFKPIPNPDYIIPVEIEGKVVDVYVLKRPWMDHFMDVLGPHYEIVVFTASLSKYADPLLDLLDRSSVVRWRLFREACRQYDGSYVKDLSFLGRDLRRTIIVDNSPHSYAFQPENAVPISTFIDDLDEQELLDVLPILLELAKPEVTDVREHIGKHITQ